MAKKTITELKDYFEAGKRPTESQFDDLIDSYVHLDDNEFVNLKSSEYETKLEFPADYQIGDYVEFLGFGSIAANASGFYEISIAYTRGNIASAATHIASASHSNHDLWRECGTINKNNYVDGNDNVCFTVDVNGGLSKFRIRALKVRGNTESKMQVVIKVRAINKNQSWQALDNRGNTTETVVRQPMTNEWDLWVGNTFSPESAKIGLKVNNEGNVGIGTPLPETIFHVKAPDNRGNVDYISGLFDRNEAAGGSNKITIKYHSSADLEVNSGYTGSGFRYGNYSDFNIVNNGLSDTFGAINFITNSQVRNTIAANGNFGIGTVNPESKLDVRFEGEPKTIKFMDAANSVDTMNSMLRFTWYNDTADLGMVRGGSANIQAMAMRVNQNEVARFASNGNAAFQGKVEAKEFLVSTTPTADFVFAADYNLRNMHDLEKFISEKNHLPEIPSAQEMTENGLSVGEFQIKLLQKIEELTLYMISQSKEIENLKSKLNHG
ncbi:hypothetical protein [Chryseobacterium populi]|uniref:Uncharacterized protein n=1 Tax=Chryseobacterium populi TaxID=1144316 RepID=J2KQM6_9FLAO|nr:hypothetical protein [Chryseobacterium populi]EJL75363.1 hypothetical protein PMI13_00510 [Chryseobacterium populi]